VSVLLNYGLNYRLAFHSDRLTAPPCRALRTVDGNRNDGLAVLDPGGEPQPVEQIPLEYREVSLAEPVVVRVPDRAH